MTFASYANYQVGNTIQPQFMAGLPMVLAGAMWLSGANAALLIAPVLGALALLTFAGLAARLVGARGTAKTRSSKSPRSTAAADRACRLTPISARCGGTMAA